MNERSARSTRKVNSGSAYCRRTKVKEKDLKAWCLQANGRWKGLVNTCCTRSLAMHAEVETPATGRESPFNAEQDCFESA
jgi:hypothetical protein